MALNMLVNGGAGCGPFNPLQSLTKQFEKTGGVSQDQFVQGRAGSSRQTFRTQQDAHDPSAQVEATRFFQDHTRFQAPRSSASTESSSLPFVAAPRLEQTRSQPWATDFLQQTPSPSNAASYSQFFADFKYEAGIVEQQPLGAKSQTRIQPPKWTTPVVRFGGPALSSQPQATTIDYDTVTRAIQELELREESNLAAQVEQVVSSTDMDELAKTANLLVESLKDTENPKFRNSSFMSLMRRLRDREVVLQDDDLVEMTSTTWASEFGASMHMNKGRAREEPAPALRRKSVHFEPDASVIESQDDRFAPPELESDLDRILRLENEEYQLMNAEVNKAVGQTKIKQANSTMNMTSQVPEWGYLQDDWERFEASATGIHPASIYAFQHHNPYMNEYFATTKHHSFHESSRFEDVLQKEAVVQNDPTNARAWFELGVKQQENEREKEAIEALKRAVHFEPSMLDAWLALAVSFTNENQLGDAYDAIEHWISNNEAYQHVNPSLNLKKADASTRERCNSLLEAMMTIIRSNPEVDADTQVALAVLLNTLEDYVKASDCFKAALAARPNDWLLYNRVGATLANSGNPNEAIDYYQRALELNPGYIRARYNLGIACINTRKYREASEFILDALVLQGQDAAEGPQPLQVTRGVTNSSLWDSLKTTYLHLKRSDLASLCDDRDLNGIRTALAANYI